MAGFAVMIRNRNNLAGRSPVNKLAQGLFSRGTVRLGRAWLCLIFAAVPPVSRAIDPPPEAPRQQSKSAMARASQAVEATSGKDTLEPRIVSFLRISW